MENVIRWLRRVPAGPVLAAASVAILWAMSARPDALARVPDVEGIPLEGAQTEAAEAGYTTRIELRDGPGRTGTVLEQQPEPGSLLARGSAISLAVTRGARQVGVPDVRGMPVDEAQRLLRESELEAGDVTYRRSPGKEPNRVVSTDPPPGSTVDAGTPVHVIAAA